MTIDQLAANALASVRSWYKHGVKSNNKWRNQPTQEHVNAECARIRASAWLQSGGRKYEATHGPYMYGERMASTLRAGNCWDLAVAAMSAVMAMDAAAVVRVVAVPAPGDHAFLTIGGTAVEVLTPFAQAQGHANYCICDPWANIACRGHEYVSSFNEKMAEWARAQKLIHFQGHWCVPTEHAWLNALLGNKLIDRQGLM